MVSSELAETRLRQRLTRLLESPGQIHTAITILQDWENRGWAPVLFGGIVRDLFLLGSRAYPRDIDVVLVKAGTDEVIREFKGAEYRLNRFGGLHMNVARWSFDVWPLAKTWAFTTDSSLAPSPENLPKTTFLNIEAIAVTLDGPKKIGRIYSSGFFRSVAERYVDINYVRNPFPALAAIRSIITAYKFHFQVSRRLAEYITSTISQTKPIALVNAQEQHYSRVLFREHDIEEIFQSFTKQLSSTSIMRIDLPERFWPWQLELWS